MESLPAILAEAGVAPGLVDLLPKGSNCYLVGGAVRDLVLGQAVKDFDFATAFDPTELARSFARRSGGKWFYLDQRRRQSRVVRRVGEKHLTYDFAPYRAGDLQGDLRLRDFTMNAMALRLDAPESLLDPLGGRQDLDRGLLRGCSAGVFADDPLRVLKGIRHASVLGFDFAPDTFREMASASGGLKRIAAERLRDEVAAIFSSPAPGRGIGFIFALGCGPLLFGGDGEAAAVAAGRSSLQAKEGALGALLESSPAWIEALFREELEGGIDRLALLGMAAFLRGYSPANPDSFAAAVRLGKKAGNALKSAARLPSQRAAEAATLTGSRRGRALWAVSLGADVWISLGALAFIGAAGGEPEGHQLIALMEDVRHCLQGGRIPDLVDGRSVCRELGLPPGPEVGKALARLRQEEIAGRVGTAEEARKFLKSLS